MIFLVRPSNPILHPRPRVIGTSCINEFFSPARSIQSRNRGVLIAGEESITRPDNQSTYLFARRSRNTTAAHCTLFPLAAAY